MFDPVTLKLNIDPLILSALREDITLEDVSANCILREKTEGKADLICKQDGVICGLQVFERVFFLLDDSMSVKFSVKDGDTVKYGQHIGEIKGDMRVILSGERTALNYLQHMSGIATAAAKSVKLLEGTGIKLLDTRKTSPNNRIFEKYAVKTGGGFNHRLGLTDGVMLKDNHISAAGSISEAVKMAREYAPFVRKIEVEAENLDMVREAADAGADIIMLDNMDHDAMKAAIDIIDGRAEVEISGNITADKIEKIRDLKVDYISSGALTHSAPILDLSLKNLHRV